MRIMEVEVTDSIPRITLKLSDGGKWETAVFYPSREEFDGMDSDKAESLFERMYAAALLRLRNCCAFIKFPKDYCADCTALYDV